MNRNANGQLVAIKNRLSGNESWGLFDAKVQQIRNEISPTGPVEGFTAIAVVFCV